MTHDNQHTEHDMLLEFVQTLANADGGILHGYGVVDDARDLLRAIAAMSQGDDSASSATPPPDGGEAGERYVVVSHGQSDENYSSDEIWGIRDTVTGHGVIVDNQRHWYPDKADAQTACDRLNAALPASGKQDSGDGGEA